MSASQRIEPLIVAGATATGKSAVAMELARLLDGEIVSVDSMQVYRGLDLGTAKPTAAERMEVRHHLVDVVEWTEPFDAARFVQLAQEAIHDSVARGKTPILCGGTGMYFNAWLNGLGASPAPDPVLRAQLEQRSMPELLDELARMDPVAFNEVDLENRRRVVRAVEVIRLTERPFSQQRAQWPERAPGMIGRSFGLMRSREDTVQRINLRVDLMFRAGLIEETRHLLEQGLGSNRTAMQAIGYRQVAEYLQGERTRMETMELVKVRTRQFAKRQLTWFRGQLDLQWLELGKEEPPEQTAARIRSILT